MSSPHPRPFPLAFAPHLAAPAGVRQIAPPSASPAASLPDDATPPAPCFAVERFDAADAAAHRDAWVDLVGRALEPNAFLDPDFALPAVQHLAGRRPSFLLVWAEEGGERGDLVAVCAVTARRGPLRGLAAAWLHDLSTLGLPLLDRDRAEGALAALLAHLSSGAASGLIVPSLPADGATAAVLDRVAATRGLDLAVLAAWERAAFGRAGPTPVDPTPVGPSGGLSSRGAKELRRQRRRLAERGALEFRSVGDGGALPAEVERFLCLEAGGWKGRAGTAMLCSPGRTAFLRTLARLFARRGLCRIDSLSLDGAPIAMALVLSAGDVDYLWKIAYREDVARWSPGVLLALDITEAQARRGRASAMDSCAVPDHPMIDRLWPDRIRLEDVAVALRPSDGAAFRRAVGIERGARRLRAEAKRLLLAWRARRARRAN